MSDRSEIKEVIDSWADWLKRCTSVRKERPLKLTLPRRSALALIGVRRCGKSFAATYLSQGNLDNCFYLNFEDPFFIQNNSVTIFDELISVFTEYSKRSPKLLLFDEIQNIPGWERWVRKIVDLEKYKIVITGSSAKMLSMELASTLTGRCLSRTIWPLSFAEYLVFTGQECRNHDEYLGALRSYMTWGGFPEVTLMTDEAEKRETLQQYLTDILYKDIIKRYEIRTARSLEQLVRYYLTNVSSLHSYNRIQKAFGLNVETARDYTSHLQDAFLVFEVNRYHRNLKVQARDPKKIYAIDTGLRNVSSLSHHEDFGKLAENLVYLHLRRLGETVYYYQGEAEVDFLVTRSSKPIAAIQVCYSNLENEKTRDREIDALLECLTATGLSDGLLLTLKREETVTRSGKKIRFVPLFQWLLSSSSIPNRLP